ncbi:hypothetical protein L210DRAFT_3505394 [Boletus edulis BED1]|uniref:Uncharacterized protein n=1 Tax=Boletus edulis BED1 TaxID=1328754 RepID=A0AAD4GDG4_BOLED|nr:hypothetical protein L210DRAFT_3505394 [Boletus edulis BED1]
MCLQAEMITLISNPACNYLNAFVTSDLAHALACIAEVAPESEPTHDLPSHTNDDHYGSASTTQSNYDKIATTDLALDRLTRQFYTQTISGSVIHRLEVLPLHWKTGSARLLDTSNLEVGTAEVKIGEGAVWDGVQFSICTAHPVMGSTLTLFPSAVSTKEGSATQRQRPGDIQDKRQHGIAVVGSSLGAYPRCVPVLMTSGTVSIDRHGCADTPKTRYTARCALVRHPYRSRLERTPECQQPGLLSFRSGVTTSLIFSLFGSIRAVPLGEKFQ